MDHGWRLTFVDLRRPKAERQSPILGSQRLPALQIVSAPARWCYGRGRREEGSWTMTLD